MTNALAYVLLIAMSLTVILVSDLFIRGKDTPGVNPAGWDFVGTVGWTVGIVLLVMDYFGWFKG